MTLSVTTLILTLLSASSCVALEGYSTIGGTFRYGHLYWTSTGNVVNFVIEAAYKRSVNTSYFKGSAADGLAQTGDVVTLFGREEPEFSFGDSMTSRLLKMTVTAYSVKEDWIMGEVRLAHKYSSPTDKGKAWVASFSGCCRLPYLVNNKDAPYLLSAEVNLNEATRSPRAVVLPQVTVPLLDGVLVSEFFVPAYDPSNEQAVHWARHDPYMVGEAVGLAGRASLAVALQPLAALTDTSGYQVACGGRLPAGSPGGAGGAAGGGCLFELLRMSPPSPAAPAGSEGSPGLTVEGWARLSTDAGGVLLSVGAASALPGAPPLPPADPCAAADAAPAECRLALLYVAMNRSHVTVGHERPAGADASAGAVLETASFALASSPAAVAAVQDPARYPPSTQTTLAGKWVHVAVVRKTRWRAAGPSGGAYFGASYKVYLNGAPLGLEDPALPALPPDPPAGPGTCGGVERFRAARCGGLLPGEGFEVGESAALPFYGPDDALWPRVGRRTSLIFGAYAGAAGSDAASPVAAALDEWRVWNGARSPAAVADTMRRAMAPRATLVAAYGDPTAVQGDPAARVSPANYRAAAALLVVYSFDSDVTMAVKSASGAICADGDRVGCVVQSAGATYPPCAWGDTSCPTEYWTTDPRFAGLPRAAYAARAPASCAPGAPAAAFCPARAAADSSGAVFHAAARGVDVQPATGRVRVNIVVPGVYQVTLRVAMADGAASVPVDFLIEVEGSPALMPRLTALAPLRDGTTLVTAPRTDFRPVPAFPGAIAAWAGFPAGIDLRAAAGAAGGWTGFTMGPTPAGARFSTVSGGANRTAMRMDWVPCPAARGRSAVCFAAATYRAGGEAGDGATVASEMRCVQWSVTDDPPPAFGAASAVRANFTMGRAGSFAVMAADANCLDAVALAVVPRNASGRGWGLPAGATLSAERGWASEGGAACGNGRAVTVTWTPSTTFGGFDQDICFSATDSLGSADGGRCPGLSPHVTVHCVAVTVARCRYALRRDQHLEQLAGLLGMDWMRLWSLNRAIGHPDFFVHAHQVLNVGHLFRAGPRDTGEGVAARLGMPWEQLLALNFDLAQEAAGGRGAGLALGEGRTVCVVPSPCAAPEESPYAGLVFRDGRFVPP